MSKVKATSNYGKGEASVIEELFDNSEQHKKELELSDTINKIISSDTFKPPLLPEVAISLTKLANQPNVSMSKVEDVAKSDPAVAGRIVAIANSALYSRGAPVRSLSMAISRLGLATVRDIAFEVVAQTTIFKVPGYVEKMRQLYDSARLAGHISKNICIELKFESEMAYLCGLLHDMGEAIILGIIGQISKNDKKTVPDEQTVSIVIQKLHPQIAAKICDGWGLPPLISDALLYHHRCEQSQDPAQMATVVAITDRLLEHIGSGAIKKEINPMEEPLFYRLNMRPDQVKNVISFAESLVEKDV